MSLSRGELIVFDQNYTKELQPHVVNLIKTLTAYRKTREHPEAKIDHNRIQFARIQYSNEGRPLLHITNLTEEELLAIYDFLLSYLYSPHKLVLQRYASLERQGQGECAYLLNNQEEHSLYLRLDHPEIPTLFSRLDNIKQGLVELERLRDDIGRRKNYNIDKNLINFYFNHEGKFRLTMGPFTEGRDIRVVQDYFTQCHGIRFRRIEDGVIESLAVRLSENTFYLRPEHAEFIFAALQKIDEESKPTPETRVVAPSQPTPAPRQTTVVPSTAVVPQKLTREQLTAIFKRPEGSDALSDRECYYVLLHYIDSVRRHTVFSHKNSLDAPAWWVGRVAEPALCQFIELKTNNPDSILLATQCYEWSEANFRQELARALGEQAADAGIRLMTFPEKYQGLYKIVLITLPRQLAQTLAVNIAKNTDIVDGHLSKRIILSALATQYTDGRFLPVNYLQAPEKSRNSAIFDNRLICPPRDETLAELTESKEVVSVTTVDFDRLSHLLMTEIRSNGQCLAKLEIVANAQMIGFKQAEEASVKRRSDASRELNVELFLREHFFRYYGFTFKDLQEDRDHYYITIQSYLPELLKANLDVHVQQINSFLPTNAAASYTFQKNTDHFPPAVITLPKAAITDLYENEQSGQGEMAAKTNECYRFFWLLLNRYLVNTNIVALFIPLLQPKSKGGNLVSRITFGILDHTGNCVPIKPNSFEFNALRRVLSIDLSHIDFACEQQFNLTATPLSAFLKIDNDACFPIRIDLMPNLGKVELGRVGANNPPYATLAHVARTMARAGMTSKYNDYLAQEIQAFNQSSVSIAALTAGAGRLSLMPGPDQASSPEEPVVEGYAMAKRKG